MLLRITQKFFIFSYFMKRWWLYNNIRVHDQTQWCSSGWESACCTTVCLSEWPPSNCEETDTVRWEPSLEVVVNKDRGSKTVFTALWAAAWWHGDAQQWFCWVNALWNPLWPKSDSVISFTVKLMFVRVHGATAEHICKWSWHDF